MNECLEMLEQIDLEVTEEQWQTQSLLSQAEEMIMREYIKQLKAGPSFEKAQNLYEEIDKLRAVVQQLQEANTREVKARREAQAKLLRAIGIVCALLET